MPAVDGRNPESPLAAGVNAVLLHQPLHPLLAHADAALPQLPPDARPSVGAAKLGMDGANVRQQRGIAQVPAMSNLPAPCPVPMKAGHAHLEHPALHANRPEARQ